MVLWPLPPSISFHPSFSSRELTIIGWKFSPLVLLRRVIGNWLGCTAAGCCCPRNFVRSRPLVLKLNSCASVGFLEYFTATGPELFASFRNDFRDSLNFFLASFWSRWISSIWSCSVVLAWGWVGLVLASHFLWYVQQPTCSCIHANTVEILYSRLFKMSWYREVSSLQRLINWNNLTMKGCPHFRV